MNSFSVKSVHRHVLSSTNLAVDVVGEVRWSVANILYRIGERMPPRGTLALMFAMFEKKEPNLT